MSGKNLTFKLILDGDSKGLVTATKQSEDVTKKLFDAIKAESEQIKQATESTSKQIGNIIPKGTTELADKLTQSLTAATGIIQDAGDNAKSTAGNFTDFGNKAEKALGQFKSDLAEAKKNLEAFSKTSASPVDIEVAKRQVDKLEKEVKQADEAFSNFHGEVGRANTKLQETDSVAKSTQKGLNTAKFAVNALAGAMATLGVGLGIRELAETADTYTNLSARINIATKEGGDFTSAMAGVHQVALMTNSSLDATASLFTRLNTVGKEMGMTQQQVLDLTKTVTQAIQVGGGSAQASEAAIQQFIQAMQGGVLRGEEFNSIMENGYGVAEALARGLGVTTGELRKMAENGELSSERVVKALQSQAGQVQATYDQFPTTIGNALQRISTSWNIVIGNMDQANGASATVAQWLVTLADNMGSVETLLNDIGKGFVWVGDQLKKIDPATID
ncbi:tape measure domain-containing protein, partial [Acinetobacter cumulans]